jgi:ribonuclease E
LNHPSYQELGDANNNRRRRRRRLGIGESPIKDETRTPSNSLTLLNEREAEVDAEPELPTTPEVLSANSKVGWIEKSERTKPIKPEIVKPVIEPPKTVYVEMTPDEQEVYALMGVSPLVRLNEEFKNPKSVIVQVTLPGQIPSASTLSENGMPASVSIESTAAEIDSTLVPVAAAIESFPDTAATDEVETSPQDVSTTTTNEGDTSDNAPSNRRRRRRSSASENSTED